MAEKVLCVMGKISSGGVESVVFSYYRALDKTKYQYDIAYENSSDREIPSDILASGARAFCVPSMSSPVSYISSLCKIIKNGNYRIIHCHNSTLSLFPLIAAKLCRVPVRIVHNHSTSAKAEKKRNAAKSVLKRITPLFANKYIACSELAARWMYGDKRTENGLVSVIPNGIKVDNFLYNENYSREIREEFNLANSTVIGHIGRFVSAKNHRFIIDIFNEYRKTDDGAVLLLLGDGPDRENIREYVQDAGLSQSVIFVGVRDDAYKFYSTFDVFLLPSLYEGLPVVSVEASASGVVQLISDTVTRECKLNENVHFLPIDDPSVWASAIMKYKDCDRQASGEEMKNSDFNIENGVNKLMQFYDRCLEEL